MKTLKVIAVIAVLILLGSWRSDCAQSEIEKRTYKDLSMKYLFPSFSKEFRRYWRIPDFARYKKALRQRYDIAEEQLYTAAPGDSVEEISHWVRIRINNWLERKLIGRYEHWRMFRERSEENHGFMSMDLALLTQAEVTAALVDLIDAP